MEFSNTSGIRSPFSPRIKQSSVGKRSLGNVSAKKNLNKLEAGEEMKGEVIYKSPQITLETYGPPLPVMVTEALAFANSEVTVKISQSGWCWLVVGRRILAWPLNPPGGAAATNAARELILPQTDLAHKSDLVDIFYEDDEQSPSCIGVSPEGVIRYWPSVRHSGVYSEVSAELGGQECAVLQHSAPIHLLATTTCTLGAVHHESVEARSAVRYCALSAGGGWLGSLGRRVSLLFFGATPHQPDVKLSGLAVVRPGALGSEAGAGAGCAGAGCAGAGCGGAGLVALGVGGAAPALQLFGAAPLAALHLPQLLARHTQGLGVEPGPREMSILDMKVADSGELVLLIAFTNRELRYLIAAVDVQAPTATVRWACGAGALRGDAAPALLVAGRTLLLYTHNYIALTTMFGAGAWACVEWGGAGGGLRGGGVAGGRLVLFDCRHAPIALTHTSSVIDTPLQSPSVTDIYTGNLSLLEIDPYEIRKVATDACGILKTAFLFHVRKDERERDLLLRGLCPRAAAPHDWQGSPQGSPKAPPQKAEESQELDALLDQTVYKIALEILDDIPTGDPRWQGAGGARGGAQGGARACSVPLGASCALGAGAQLRDKQLALALFAHLLLNTPVERALARVTTDDGRVLPTLAALGALAERLAAALHLHDTAHPALDRAVLQVVAAHSCEEAGSVVEAWRAGVLSARDVCFRRASLAPAVLHELAHDARALPLLVSALREMQAARARWARAPPPAQPLLRAIADLLPACVNELKSDAMPVSAKGQMLSALCSIADILLAETTGSTDNTIADKIFDALVEAGEKERALLLAEKYKHFDALIEMCLRHHALERLFAYIDKYIDEGVAERAFRIVGRGAGGGGGGAGAGAGGGGGGKAWARLLQHAAASPRLAHRLPAAHTPHEDANILVLLSSGQYLAAGQRLAERAHAPRAPDATLTVAASLSKLCALAGGAEGAAGAALLERSARALCLCAHRAAAPPALRARSAALPRDPAALAQMYIDCEEGLTEFEYKQALDLTELVDDTELKEDLRLKIWCASIMSDSWLEEGSGAGARAGAGAGKGQRGDMDAARHALRDKTFFRLIDLVQLMGDDASVLVPPLEELVTSRALAELVADPRALYLLKYGYETLYADAPDPDHDCDHDPDHDHDHDAHSAMQLSV